MQLALADFLSKSQDPSGYNVMNQVKDTICKDCTVLAVKMDVVFENGTRADVSRGVYLHHIIAFNFWADGSNKRAASSLSMVQAIPFCSSMKSKASRKARRSVKMPSAASKGGVAIFGFGAVDEFKQWFTVRTLLLILKMLISLDTQWKVQQRVSHWAKRQHVLPRRNRKLQAGQSQGVSPDGCRISQRPGWK
jgi:hypothetical protein